MSSLRPLLPCFAFASAFAAAVLAGGAAEASVAHRFVNASGIGPGHVAWIRSGPGISYTKVGYLRASARHIRTLNCKAIARENWCHVQFQGTRGWIQDRYLRAPHVMQG